MIQFKEKIGIAIALCLSFVASLLLVLTPYTIGTAVDAMVGIGLVDLVQVRHILMVAFAFFFAYFVLTWLVSLYANTIALSVAKRLRSQLEVHLNRMPLAFIDSHPHGDLMNHFSTDSELIADGVYQLIAQLLSGVFVVLIAFFFMLSVDVLMTLMVCLMVPVMVLTSRAIARRSLVLYRKQQALAGAMGGKVQEALSNHALILASNYEEEVIKDFETIHRDYNTVGEKAQFLGALVNPTVRVINNCAYVLIGLMGAYASKRYGLSVGTLTGFISISIIFSKPFNEFSSVVAQLMAAKASYDRIQDTLRHPREVDIQQDRHFTGERVTFDHVSFGYKKGSPVIQDLSLDIPPLSKVAIVGPTGAGKSTLINILMRFYDVDSGAIYVDGINTHLASKKSLRNVMSIVLQDPWLFEGTIRQNIKYGNPQASEEAMFDAAKKAGCHNLISSLDMGYDTRIALGSSNLSMGQKQLITIARALLVDVPIVILDEATSNVDVLTEFKIQEVFHDIMKEKTSFFVAHRLHTVIDSDVILVMKDGRLIEHGTHQTLMRRRGFYYELYQSQGSNL